MQSARFTGLALRIVGRRRWRLLKSPIDLVLEIQCRDVDTARFSARSESKQVLTSLDVTTPLARLAPLRTVNAQAIEVPDLMASAWTCVPAPIRYALEHASSEHVQLALDDELIDVPWELLGPTLSTSLGLVSDVSRIVLTDVMDARRPLVTARLRAVIVAPEYDGNLELRARDAEVKILSSRLKLANADLVVVDGKATADDVLAVMKEANLFHFIGHASSDTELGGELHLNEGRLSAISIHACLKEHHLALAFINACSSGSERPWINGGANLYGLASPFVQRGAYFIGARWPIKDSSAREFATAFYDSFLPTLDLRAWANWLRGKPVSGQSLGRSVRAARKKLLRDAPTLSTWAAFVTYGNPSAFINLD